MNLAALDRHRQAVPAYEARCDAGNTVTRAYESVKELLEDARYYAKEAREQAFALMEAAGAEPEVSKIDRVIAELDEIKQGKWRE